MGVRRRSAVWRVVVVVVLAVVIGIAALELFLRTAARVAETQVESKRDSAAVAAGADVAVYGDSTPYGLGNERAFPAIVAEATGLRIANRAKPGINSSQARLILEDDRRHTPPRCTIVLVGVNDVWNLDDVDPDLVPPDQRWQLGLHRFRVWRMARLWWYGGRTYERVKGQGFQRDRASAYRDMDTRAITRTAVRAMHAAATADGGRILFVGYQRRGWNAGGDRVEAIIAEEFPERLLSIRHAFPDLTLFQRDGFHVTDEGQALIAKMVEAEVVRRGWLGACHAERVTRVRARGG